MSDDDVHKYTGEFIDFGNLFEDFPETYAVEEGSFHIEGSVGPDGVLRWHHVDAPKTEVAWTSLGIWHVEVDGSDWTAGGAEDG